MHILTGSLSTRDSIKDQKLLYHLTAFSNLESILTDGLVARKYLLKFDDIADQKIIDFREKNSLNIYVPFHFFASNPFDGRVQKEHIEKEFIYICVYRKLAKSRNFKIIPQHPASMQKLTFYEYLEGIKVIDWDTMNTRNYLDNNCKNICMAECLSPTKVSPINFSHIFVKNIETEDYIKTNYANILRRLPQLHININKKMFVS